ncbi:hypothetical protein M5D96_013141, partial [Drosophila gunungcola]
VPSSKQVCCSREPLYSQPLLGTDKTLGGSMPFKKHNSSDCGHDEIQINSKTTLDNPAILEQQLEALAYHKLQMEKKGLLGGKPFYALDGKPYCESDYLQTLEKCSVCMEPILERILRATGKPYHPQCFTCVVCGKSLDGLLFTVDATNQNYCITDFHKTVGYYCHLKLKVEDVIL